MPGRPRDRGVAGRVPARRAHRQAAGGNGLGRYLKKVVGRWAGGHTLLRGHDKRGNASYAVVNQAEAEAWRKENSKAEQQTGA